MTETAPEVELDISELQQYVTRIEAGAAIIYSLLNEIHNIHTDVDGKCQDCGQNYPCKTEQIILSAMVEEKPTE
jgi:hypothetical protein